MANDSTGMGPATSEQDATPINDGYFTDMQGDEDAFFGPQQLAQANTGSDGKPVAVPVPPNENVIRVQVSPGEILELASPFDAGAALLAREADGNLAIKVGDVTVILVGFVAANETAPVVVETSDGNPIDIAILLASTDPNIDIQTAAGPAEGPQGQGADNTGGLLTLLQGGAGLGGLNSVGAQDQTELSYSTIDNTILKEFAAETPLFSSSSTGFSGIQEPFLIDPANTTPYTNFGDFFKDYKADVENSVGWADFTGTKANANGDLDAYLAKTAFTQEIAHSSDAADPFRIELTLLDGQVSSLSSDGHALYVDMVNSTSETAFVRREGDGALVLVIHAHQPGELSDTSAPEGTGPYQLDTFLINRLDHPDQGNDILGITIPYSITHTGQEMEPTLGDAHVDILDDIPEAHDPTYFNIVHGQTTSEGLALAKSSGSTTTEESHDYGHVDEDWLRWGNHDKDNDPSGVDPDPAHGDDIGDRFVCGTLDINFGADGPAGAGGNDYCSDDDGGGGGGLAGLLVTPSSPALQLQNFQDKDGNFISKDETFTSHGHTLIVLDHYTDCCGVEHLVVGYHDEKPTDVLFAPSGGEGEGWSCDTVVFTLTLNVNPDDSNFQEFTFKLQGPLDHPDTKAAESNLLLNFSVLATDDDGDHPINPVDIKIQVNDDSPLVCEAVYYNESNPIIIGVDAISGGDTFKDTIGRVDEDWLSPYGSEDCEITPTDDGTGGTQVCGYLNIKYGGDGPGDGANDQQTALASGLPENVALALDTGLSEGDTFPGVKSGGHALVVLVSSSGYLSVGIEGDSEKLDQVIFTLSLNTDPDSSSFQQFEFNLYGPLDHTKGDNTESTDSDILLDFKVIAHDYDGDPVETSIQILVNDDTPEAHDDSATVFSFPPAIAEAVGSTDGNVLVNDLTGADIPTVVTAIAFGAGASKAVDADGTAIQGAYGLLTIHSDGTYEYQLNDKGSPGESGPLQDVFHYTITDFDGDKSSADLTIKVNGACGPALAMETLTSLSRVGDDTGERGHASDLIFGTDNADTLTSGHGADKLSGGAGDDTFLNIDVADLDGSNTLDGTHSIDGGKGTDTLDLSHLASFDSSQAARVENVEVLDFTGGGATAVSLDYGAAYGITQVGGLHAFTIKGDSSDSVTLSPSAGNSWSQTGTDVVGSDGHLYNVFEAGAGAAKVTVSIEQGVHVEAS